MEVTIHLRDQRLAGPGQLVGSQEEILRCIQDEYVRVYLDKLGIEATPANKAQMLKLSPLDDCEVHGVWSEENPNQGVANALKIAPPMRYRAGFEHGEVGDKDIDKGMFSYLYGDVQKLNVEPPPIRGRTILPVHISEEAGEDGRRTVNVAKELIEELDREKQQVEREKLRQKQRQKETNAAGGAAAAVPGASLDTDRKDRLKQELEVLKTKFILPFACERPVKEGSKRMEICPWPPGGDLDLELTANRAEQISQPLAVEMESIQKYLKTWVKDQMPLELLSHYGKDYPRLLEDLRSKLYSKELCQLTGLLAHLLYWMVFGTSRQSDKPRLAERALQGLFAAAHELWVSLESQHRRELPQGRNLAMPCVLLTIKQGIYRCYELQYPNLFGEISGEWEMRQMLYDRINILLMRLFDPDNLLARFGRLDGSGTAMALSKRLDLLASAESQNCTKQKRLQGRANRATPLVRAALQASKATLGGGYGTNNPKTRTLLGRSDQGGCAGPTSVVVPPEDGRWRDRLLQSAMQRVGVGSLPPIVSPKSSGSASARTAPSGGNAPATSATAMMRAFGAKKAQASSDAPKSAR